MGKLVTRTIIAQAVGIFLTSAITRLFSPEIYGVASVFISIVSIMTVISCMHYELAILLPKYQTETGEVFLACIGVLLCFSTVLISVFLFFGEHIVNLFNAPEVPPYLSHLLLQVSTLLDFR